MEARLRSEFCGYLVIEERVARGVQVRDGGTSSGGLGAVGGGGAQD